MTSQILKNCLNVLKTEQMKNEFKEVFLSLINFAIKELYIYIILIIFFIFSSLALHLGILIILIKNFNKNSN